MNDAKLQDSMCGKVALVTGASRGIGKGIAEMLCQAGAVVYITGRKLGDASQPLTLAHTANEVSYGGKTCIPVPCDHGKDDDVKELFEKISSEQDGRLDLLVNNAFGGVEHMFQQGSTLFYEQPMDAWEKVVDIGTRSNYIAACFAARMMVKRQSGLIVNVSSAGGLLRIFNSIPYGVGKEAIDRMSMEMGMELRKHNVACISLWPGPVKTELTKGFSEDNSRVQRMFRYGEDTTFSGKCIVALANDKDLMKKSGRIHMTGELAYTYSLKDIDGEQPLCLLQPKSLVREMAPSLAWLIPSWLFLPRWIVALKAVRF